MLASGIPAKYQVPFANSAAPGFIEAIPLNAVTPGKASFTQGFSQLNFEMIAAGGIPPWGADFNGLLNSMTAWLQYAQAGQIALVYDATFSTQVGGYPAGALLQQVGGGKFWLSSVDNNITDPDTSGAGWIDFPDALIQIQGGNFAATDSGTANHFAITLSPVPASLASIIGAPIRFLAGHPNTLVNPDININGLGAVTMINSNGNALLVGQINRAGQLVEGFLDNVGKFQVTSPAPIPSTASAWITGVIYEWPSEVVPSGTLECNGQQYLISTYPGLYAIIGNRFGGDGITYFKVPDKRGAFTRGGDHGRGLDPRAGSRTNSGNGTVGDHVGTWEAQALQSFTVPCTGGPIFINNPQAYLAASTWTSPYGDGYTFPAKYFPMSLGIMIDGLATPSNPVLSFNPNYPGTVMAPNLLSGFIDATWNPTSGVKTSGGYTGTNPNRTAVNSAVLMPAQGYASNGSITTQSGGGVGVNLSAIYADNITGLTGSYTGVETRPVNISMMYIIAY